MQADSCRRGICRTDWDAGVGFALLKCSRKGVPGEMLSSHAAVLSDDSEICSTRLSNVATCTMRFIFFMRRRYVVHAICFAFRWFPFNLAVLSARSGPSAIQSS